MTSLSTRITLTVTLLLAACGVAAGVALHRALRQAAEARLGARLDARLAWLEGALDVEAEDGEVRLAAREEPTGAAEGWEVSTPDGRVLWCSAGGGQEAVGGARGAPAAEPGRAAGAGPGVVPRSRRLAFGPPGGTALEGAALSRVDRTPAGTRSRDRPAWERVAAGDVPGPALAAARSATAGAEPPFELLDAWRRTRVKKKDRGAPPTFELHGLAGGREYEVRADAGGRLFSARGREPGRYPDYQFPPADPDEGDAGAGGPAGGGRRLELALTARASRAEADAELARASRALWTLGPLALAATAALLGLAIRWQLRPLARITEEAARVGPGDLSAPGAGDGGRVGPTGGSTELVRLRGAINAMLGRLADGLARERRFAATAAHELRTPLAQMRLTLEVALRRERGAAEYRRALEEMAEDVDRLQRLVTGLLDLARASMGATSGAGAGAGAAGPAPGRPVALAPLLAKAARVRGPARLAGAAAADRLWVAGDEELLLSALGNVLDNAARYAPGEPPEIRVEAGEEAAGAGAPADGRPARGDGGRWVCVVVADHGPGISPADRERVFEPLTRLGRAVAPSPAPRERSAGGSGDGSPDGVPESAAAPPPGSPPPPTAGVGLGLAVARGAVRSAGGDLFCRPRGDGGPGAEFVFRLRRLPPAADGA